jgi:hypothetical protein
MIQAPTMDERDGKPSASGMPRIIPCAGSFQLEKRLTDPSCRKAARRGDRIHDVMAGKAAFANLSHSDKICAERMMYEEGRLVEKLEFEGAKQIREQRFKIIGFGMETVVSGKPDVVHIMANRALVINYKTGFYASDPIAKNYQMLTEGCCVHFHMDFLESLTIGLIHPNFEENGEISQHHTMPKSKWLSIRKIITMGAIKAIEPDAPRTPGEKQCQWCLGKKTKACREYIEYSSTQ